MNNLNKPWLNKSGRALSDEDLKETSRNWGPETWEAYLKTLEAPIEGVQLTSHKEFRNRCNNMVTSIFEFSSSESSIELQAVIENSLKSLTKKQAFVIQRYFFDGRSEREIAAEIQKSQGTIQEIKKTALKRIKTQLEKNPFILTIMRGMSSSSKDLQTQNQDLLEELFPQYQFQPFGALADKEEVHGGVL